MTDSGRAENEPSARKLPLGARVIDRESADGDADAARVVVQRDGTASEVRIGSTGATVAELNPGYPADASVVTVAFEPALDDELPDEWRQWTPVGLAAAVREVDIALYDYPVPRLRRVADA